MDFEFLFCHFLILISIIELVWSDDTSTKIEFEKDLRRYLKVIFIFYTDILINSIKERISTF